MNLKAIKKKFNCLIKTPLHPQWLLARYSDKNASFVASEIKNNVLDIGCGHKLIKKYLDVDIKYYGLDYYSTF